MTSDLDIYRSANLLAKRHGEAALIEAAMKADKLLEVGQISLLPNITVIVRHRRTVPRFGSEVRL